MKVFTCPNCSSPMQNKAELDYEISSCSTCSSLLTNKSSIESIAPGLIDKEIYEHKVPEENDVSQQRICPVCKYANMSKIKVIPFCNSILDYCSRCESIYFDKGEYQELLANVNEEEHFRKYIEGNLLKIDLIKDDFYGATGSYRGPIYYIKVSVYFKTSFNFEIYLCSEKRADLLLKLLGLFKKQDIEIANKDFDRTFILQGNEPEKIRKVFSNETLRKYLLHLSSNSCKFYSSNGTLEMFNDHICYIEGPYKEKFDDFIIPFDQRKTIKDIINMDDEVIPTIFSASKCLNKIAEQAN